MRKVRDLSYSINTQPAKPSPPFPGQKPTVTCHFPPGFPKHPALLWQPLSSLCSLGKGPDVAVRKKHSSFSWSGF